MKIVVIFSPRCAAVGGLVHIHVHIVVHKHRAADRGHTGGLVADPELVNDLGNHAVHDAVTAAGAVVERNVGQNRGTIKNHCHTLP